MTLDIPDEARAAGWSEFEAATRDRAWLSQAYARALEAAVPLALAAELDRLADDMRSFEPCAEHLEKRARELRGGTRPEKRSCINPTTGELDG